MMKLVSPFLAALVLSACTTSAAQTSEKTMAHSDESQQEKVYPRDEHGEVMPFEAEKNATKAVDAALVKAAAKNKHALIVMGGNWCHDSRALATHFEKDRFKTLLKSHYVLEYIDVGMKTENQHIAKRFGLEGTKGTPTVFIVDGTGKVLNLDTAPTWRNAASRKEQDVYNYFRNYAHDGKLD